MSIQDLRRLSERVNGLANVVEQVVTVVHINEETALDVYNEHQNDGDDNVGVTGDIYWGSGLNAVIEAALEGVRQNRTKIVNLGYQLHTEIDSLRTEMINVFSDIHDEIISIHAQQTADGSDPLHINATFVRRPNVVVNRIERQLEYAPKVVSSERIRDETGFGRWLDRVANKIRRRIRDPYRDAEQFLETTSGASSGAQTATRVLRLALGGATTKTIIETTLVPKKISLQIKAAVMDGSFDQTAFNALTSSDDDIASMIGNGFLTETVNYTTTSGLMSNAVTASNYTSGGNNEVTYHTPSFDAIGSAVIGILAKVITILVSEGFLSSMDVSGIPIEEITSYVDVDDLTAGVLENIITSEPGGGDVNFGVTETESRLILTRMYTRRGNVTEDGDTDIVTEGTYLASSSNTQKSEPSGPFNMQNDVIVHRNVMTRWSDVVVSGRRAFESSLFATADIIADGSTSNAIDYVSDWSIDHSYVDPTDGSTLAVTGFFVDDRLFAWWDGAAWQNRTSSVTSL
jgi:hypothetical protein